MATVQPQIIMGCSGGTALPTSGTNYLPLGGAYSTTSENYQVYLPITTPGTILNFNVWTSGAAGANASWTFTVRKSSSGTTLADTALTTSIAGASQTTNADTTHRVTISATDISSGNNIVLISVAASATAPAGSIYGAWSVEFRADNQSESILFGSSQTQLSTSATQYLALCGGHCDCTATIHNAQFPAPCAGTITGIIVKLEAAPGTSKSRTFSANVAGTDGVSVTISGSNTYGVTTGGNTAVTAGQLICVSSAVSNSPAASRACVGVVFHSTTEGDFIIPMASADRTSNSYSIGVCGSGQWYVSDTNKTKQASANSWTGKALYIDVAAAPGTGKSYTLATYNGASQLTDLTATISDTATAANVNSKSVALTNTALLYYTLSSSGSPSAAAICGAICGYIAPLSLTSVPTVTTTAANHITPVGARSGGNVTSDGGATITARGVCYGTSENPTIDDSKVTASGTTGVYTVAIGSLSANTTYHIRAYATNSEGTSYGSDSSFVTGNNTIYYVDAASGSDSNNGTTTGTAWQTMNKITTLKTTFKGGDKIKFKCGQTHYKDGHFLQIAASGDTDYPITIESYGTGSKPILHSGNATAVTDWSGGPVYSVAHAATVYELFEDDKNLGPQTNPITGVGQWYYSSGTLYYRPSDDVNNHTVRADTNITESFTLSGCDYITIQNLHLLGSCLTISTSNNINILSNDIVEGCWIKCVNTNATVTYEDILIQGNTFDYCNAPTIWMEWAAATISNVDNLQIINNIMSNVNMTQFGGRYVASNADNDAIYLQNCTNLLIDGNEIGPGNCEADAAIQHWINDDSVGASGIIKNNYIHDVSSFGIFISNGKGNNHQIYNNIIVNYASGTNARYANQGGIWVSGPATSGSHGKILNNTIYNGGAGKGSVGLGFGSNLNYYDIKNNIVHTADNLAYAMTTATASPDYNCYYPGSVGSPFSLEGTAKTLAQWKGLFGEANSKTSDPKFLNAGESYALDTDFKLKADSTCLGKGIWVGLTTDYAEDDYYNETNGVSMGVYNLAPTRTRTTGI